MTPKDWERKVRNGEEKEKLNHKNRSSKIYRIESI